MICFLVGCESLFGVVVVEEGDDIAVVVVVVVVATVVADEESILFPATMTGIGSPL